MHLLRRSPSVVWLALFALIGQLVLSLGHTHSQTSRVSTQLAASQSDYVGVHASNPNNAPYQGSTDRDCAVCWTVAVAGALIIPDAVTIQAPALQPAGWSACTSACEPNGRLAHFQARAPPVSSLT